jgi:hypothetical protein
MLAPFLQAFTFPDDEELGEVKIVKSTVCEIKW